MASLTVAWGKTVVHARRGDNAIVRQVLGDVQYLRVIDKLRNELGKFRGTAPVSHSDRCSPPKKLRL